MFSVVMPLWNKRHTVAATIAAALGQNYRDFELIVVDDGSNDGSSQILSDFADPRIRRLVQARAGPGPARNAGVEASHADWIAFLDADDIWLPDHLDELDRIRTNRPDAGLIGTAYASRIRCEEFRPDPAAKSSIEPINFFERVGAGGTPLCTSSSAIPRSTYVEIGGFVAAPRAQDNEYFARIALERPVVVSSRVTTVYRLRTGGISDTIGRKPLDRIATLRDLGPNVAVLVDLYPTIQSPEMRRAVDCYVHSQYISIVRKSARIGDFRALRMLPKIRPRAATLAERLILIVALMPRPLARAAYGLAHRIILMSRAFVKGVR